MTQDLTKHTTAQVVAALSKHHDWTAEAPKTDGLPAVKCNSDGLHVFFEYYCCGEWKIDRAPDIRPDWTIRRADGSIVERKARRKHVKIGRLNFVKKHNDHGIYYDTRFSPEKGVNYNLFAVRKP
jgi:hypothetical protein